jgi:hypothetical protein
LLGEIKIHGAAPSETLFGCKEPVGRSLVPGLFFQGVIAALRGRVFLVAAQKLW